MPFVCVNGIRLRFEVWGVGEVPLVLLHGLGSSADDWFMQLPAFAAHYRCIAFDLRGHGLSEKPAGPYTVPLFASDVAETLRSLGAAPAHVLGLSLGGMVAQQLAVAHPHVVRSLVLINTLPGIWPPVGKTLLLGARRLGAPWRPRTMTAQAVYVASQLFPEPGQVLLRKMTEQRLAANDPVAYRRATFAIARYRPGAALGRITCPVLIVAGEEDRVVSQVYQARLRRSISHALFASVPGGHACNIDHPDEVNTAVLSFLQQNRP